MKKGFFLPPDAPMINSNQPMPLYYQISNFLEKVIEENNISSGYPLPSEECLAKYFKVSRPTINKAIQHLIKKTIIVRDKGKKALVKEKTINLLFFKEVTSFGESLRKAHIRYSTRLLESKIIENDEKISKLLGYKDEASLYYIKRLRYIEDEPSIVVESFLPMDIFPGLLNHDFKKRNLYSVIKEEYNIFPAYADRKVRAIASSEEDSLIFAIPIGFPLLQLDSIITSQEGVKYEYFTSKLMGEKAVLFARVFPPENESDRF